MNLSRYAFKKRCAFLNARFTGETHLQKRLRRENSAPVSNGHDDSVDSAVFDDLNKVIGCPIIYLRKRLLRLPASSSVTNPTIRYPASRRFQTALAGINRHFPNQR